MIAITGTVKNGQVILDAPGELSDGTRVEVLPVPVLRFHTRHARGGLADDARGHCRIVGPHGSGRTRLALD